MDSSWAVVCSLMLVTPLFGSHVGKNYTWCILVSNQRNDFFTQRSFCISYLPVKFWFASFISHANIVYHAMSRCQDILAIKKRKGLHNLCQAPFDNWLFFWQLIGYVCRVYFVYSFFTFFTFCIFVLAFFWLVLYIYIKFFAPSNFVAFSWLITPLLGISLRNKNFFSKSLSVYHVRNVRGLSKV